MTDYPTPVKTDIHPSISSVARLSLSVAIGAACGAVAAVLGPWQVIPMIVWDVTALTWFSSVWWRVARLDAEDTSVHATNDDPRRAATDAIVLSASVASLAAVLVGVLKASHMHGSGRPMLLAAGVATIIVSWAAVHTLFTLRYAALFYSGTDGGVDFKQSEKPSYADFAYLAFTIGMTYQVSDTDLTTKEIRHTVLRHALLSYLFGTVIIATTINLAAGLVK